MSTPDDGALAQWLRAVRDTGDDLDRAPGNCLSPEDFEVRRATRRACSVCRYRTATTALVAHTLAGARWIDACWTCYPRIRLMNEVASDYPIG